MNPSSSILFWIINDIHSSPYSNVLSRGEDCADMMSSSCIRTQWHHDPLSHAILLRSRVIIDYSRTCQLHSKYKVHPENSASRVLHQDSWVFSTSKFGANTESQAQGVFCRACPSGEWGFQLDTHDRKTDEKPAEMDFYMILFSSGVHYSWMSLRPSSPHTR